MKTSRILVALSAIVAIVACSDTDTQNFGDDQMIVKTMTITADREDASSRTSLDSSGGIFWSESDEISIFEDDGGTAKKFTTTDSQTTTADFTGDDFINTGGNYYAIYPHSASNTADYNNANISFTLPATQSYTDEGYSFVNGANIAVAVSSDLANNMSFKNVCGALRLGLLGTDKVTSIVVTSSDYNLSGEATVSLSDYDNSNLPLSFTEGSKSVTLDCGDGVQLDGSTQTIFTIVVPPTDEVDSTLDITINMEGRAARVSTANAIPIVRSRVSSVYNVEIASALSIFDITSEGKYNDAYISGDSWDIDITCVDDETLDSDQITAIQAAITASSEDHLTINLKGSAKSSGTLGLFENVTKSFDLDLSEAAIASTTGNYVNFVPAGFAKNSSMKNLILNKDIQYFGNEGAYQCLYLETVTLGEGERTATLPATGDYAGYYAIGNYAFANIGSPASTPQLKSIDMSWANRFSRFTLSNSGASLQSIDMSAAGNFGTFFAGDAVEDAQQSLTELTQFGSITITINSDKKYEGGSATPSVTSEGKWINKAWAEILYVD